MAKEIQVNNKAKRVSGAASFTLKNFLAEVRKTGLARPTRFEIIIQPPTALTGAQQVSLLADATFLPGRRVITGRQQLFGPPEYFPVGIDYGGDNLSITFLVDRELNTKLFFDGWMDTIVTPTQSQNPAWHTTNYRSNYIGSIIINQLDESDTVVYSVTVYDAFPIAVNPMQVDNNLTNTVHKLNVTFNYRYWDINTIAPNTKANSSIWDDIFGIFGKSSVTPGTPTLPIRDTNTNQSQFALTPQQQAQNVLQPGTNTTGTGSPGGEFFLIK